MVCSVEIWWPCDGVENGSNRVSLSLSLPGDPQLNEAEELSRDSKARPRDFNSVACSHLSKFGYEVEGRNAIFPDFRDGKVSNFCVLNSSKIPDFRDPYL